MTRHLERMITRGILGGIALTAAAMLVDTHTNLPLWVGTPTGVLAGWGAVQLGRRYARRYAARHREQPVHPHPWDIHMRQEESP